MEANYLLPQNQAIYKLRKEKVDAEASILATCFNLTRMITIIGATELMIKLSGI